MLMFYAVDGYAIGALDDESAADIATWLGATGALTPIAEPEGLNWVQWGLGERWAHLPTASR